MEGMRRSGEDEDEDDGSRRHDSGIKHYRSCQGLGGIGKMKDQCQLNSLKLGKRFSRHMKSDTNVNGDSAYCWYNCTPQKYAPQLITFCHKIDFFDNSFE
ncbi:hypothetical protein AAC387_Pa02g0936 [Persea americana]